MSSSSSSRPSYSRGSSFHDQPPPKPESVAMAPQAYLAHKTALAEGHFVDIGMRKHRSVRQVVNGGVSAGKEFCKTNILPRKSEVAPPESVSLLPVSEKAPKIAPPRPDRNSGWFGVPDEPLHRGSQDSDRTITPEEWTRNRTLREVKEVPSDAKELRENPELRDQDGFF